MGCEACHGPGSRHVAWASAGRAGQTATARLDEGAHRAARRAARRSVDDERGDGKRASLAAARQRSRDRDLRAVSFATRADRRRIRGRQAASGLLPPRPAQPAAVSRRRPAARRGVRLGLVSPEPHVCARRDVQRLPRPAQRKAASADGNAVCATCHVPAKYDGPQHTHHQVGSTGATCAGCHMPTTTYMVVDPRHDHSLRIPAAGALRQARHAQRLHELPHDARREVGGREGRGVVRSRASAGTARARRTDVRGSGFGRARRASRSCERWPPTPSNRVSRARPRWPS